MQFFKNAAIAQRWRAELLDPYLHSFVAALSRLGYSDSIVEKRLYILRDLMRWLERNALGVPDLDDNVIHRFLEERRCERGSLKKEDSFSVRQFLDHLRDEGTIRVAEPTIDLSPLASLQRRYDNYLRKERGILAVTVRGYWRLSRQLLVDRFGDSPIRLRELTPSDVSGFLLRYAQSRTPTLAKSMVTALRSFLRFLFQHQETDIDLAKVVLTIPSWDLAAIPKYLKADEVERVLRSCDRNTSIGRRDYAVLLLLARLGLRAGEVVALELDDIDWRAGEFTVRGKGRYHDRLPLPQDVGKALATYVFQDRPKFSTRRIFLRARAPYRGFGDPSAVCTIVRCAVKRAGLKPSTTGAHLLRRSLATEMLRQGASMAEIGKILRHRAAKTTEIYAKVDIDGLRSIAKPWPTTEVIDE